MTVALTYLDLQVLVGRAPPTDLPLPLESEETKYGILKPFGIVVYRDNHFNTATYKVTVDGILTYG